MATQSYEGTKKSGPIRLKTNLYLFGIHIRRAIWHTKDQHKKNTKLGLISSKQV